MRSTTTPRGAALLLLYSALTLGCTTIPPYEEPFEATRVEAADGALAVDQIVVLFDASGSIDPQAEFPTEKALLESFVQGMPDGDYDAEIVAFGGDSRDESGFAGFDRDRLGRSAREARFIGEDTPLAEVLSETASTLDGRRGTAAVVLMTDGVPSLLGRPRDGGPTLDAARSVVEAHSGTVCFHTVHTGSDSEGAELLEQISALTPCGSHRSSGAIDSGAPLYAFQREIFLGGADDGLADVAAPPPPGLLDSDGDGVPDVDDQCPGTPKSANADETGCWSTAEVRFGSDSTAIDPELAGTIASLASVMVANPNLRVRVDGHTDATGPAAYNQALSERRAESVRAALVAQGVDAGRIDVQGHGETQPSAPNDTPEGRAANRRIEFTVLHPTAAG